VIPFQGEHLPSSWIIGTLVVGLVFAIPGILLALRAAPTSFRDYGDSYDLRAGMALWTVGLAFTGMAVWPPLAIVGLIIGLTTSILLIRIGWRARVK